MELIEEILNKDPDDLLEFSYHLDAEIYYLELDLIRLIEVPDEMRKKYEQLCLIRDHVAKGIMINDFMSFVGKSIPVHTDAIKEELEFAMDFDRQAKAIH